MPYIDEESKKKYEPVLGDLRKTINVKMSKGELTYLVYALALQYVQTFGKGYTNISTAISSLIDAAEELRRRELNPYEDEKIKQNGDVK